jgi:hypothetical protein
VLLVVAAPGNPGAWGNKTRETQAPRHQEPCNRQGWGQASEPARMKSLGKFPKEGRGLGAGVLGPIKTGPGSGFQETHGGEHRPR